MPLADSRRLILASASPRRREILTQLDIPFQVMVPDVAELADGEPDAVARENARRKAEAVAREREEPGDAVLGADTVVAVDDRLLPKPRDTAQAREWLELLAGREHRVVSAVCLVREGRTDTAASATAVRFRSLTPAEIDWYLATGEWEGKAGAYAIQGRGAAFVESIAGDFWTVVGLPVPALLDLLGPGWLCPG